MQKGNKSLVVSFVIVIAFLGLVVYTLATPKPKSKVKNIIDNQATNINNSMEQDTNTNTNINNEQTQTTDQVAKEGDTLVVNYTGKLDDGTVFDSNIDPKFGHVQPFEFTLGAGQVIKGWDEGFVGMKVGEKKTLVIPPEKAYGDQAVGPIPANSTLTFDVELVGIK